MTPAALLAVRAIGTAGRAIATPGGFWVAGSTRISNITILGLIRRGYLDRAAHGEVKPTELCRRYGRQYDDDATDDDGDDPADVIRELRIAVPEEDDEAIDDPRDQFDRPTPLDQIF